MCFILNLVELGSNYLPLLLIVPKMHSFFLLGEIIRFRQKRRLHERFQERLEVRGSPEHYEQQSRGKQESARVCHKGAWTQKQANLAQPVHGRLCMDARSCTGDPRPCVGARSIVRRSTGGCASGRLRDSAIFLGLFIRFSFTFGGSLDFFQSRFEGRISVYLRQASINPFRGRLDYGELCIHCRGLEIHF